MIINKVGCDKMQKFIKDMRDKVVGILDDIAEQLGLQPKLVPVNSKNRSGRKKK